MRRRRETREVHNWRRFNSRLSEAERDLCRKRMDTMIDKASKRASALVILHDAKTVREIDGSRGDLVCCIVRGGMEHTWMMRDRKQMKKGCRQALRVEKILWHKGVRK